MVTSNSFEQMTLIFTWMIHIPLHISLVSKFRWSWGLSSILQKKKYRNQIPKFKTTDSFLNRLCTYGSIKKRSFWCSLIGIFSRLLVFFFLQNLSIHSLADNICAKSRSSVFRIYNVQVALIVGSDKNFLHGVELFVNMLFACYSMETTNGTRRARKCCECV